MSWPSYDDFFQTPPHIKIIFIQLHLTVSVMYGLFLVPSLDAEAPGGGDAGVWKPNPGHE